VKTNKGKKVFKILQSLETNLLSEMKT